MNLSDHLPQLTEDQIAQLNTLTDLFLETNKQINLSSIRDRDGVLIKHVVDSLLILPYLKLKAKDKVLDVGTGGGFPGLALAIVYPEVHFTLLDATQKKINAVQAMSDSLGLKNMETEWDRAEELAHEGDFRHQFDLVISRALAHFGTNLELCMPFVRPGGKFFAYQGPEMAEKWMNYNDMAKKLGGKLISCHNTVLPVEEAKRCFIEVEQTTACINSFPRPTSQIRKRPLEPETY
ncbi:MAG: 16S rRNA (guanine(527)-N(7))-methyltransferase RsmG [Candidatus Gracilibacteria bacterium]|nr:16S rRNA (guanine(527)-N(7))-methyltransferase RsmG [Candidatus Gracilibacteria bacterium]